MTKYPIKTEKYGDATARADSYAEDSLRDVADIIEAALQPPARGVATAKTLREIAGILPERSIVLFPLDIAAAMERLGREQPDDDPRVTSRRTTCKEISEAIQARIRGFVGNMPTDSAMLWRWGRVLHVVVEQWSGNEDPRLAAIAATANREAEEVA